MYNILFFLAFLWLTSLQASEPQFAVVVPSYNNENFCEKNLKSIFQQTYPNWKLYYIHDAHTDATEEKVRRLIKSWNMSEKCVVISNKKRKGALRNLYETIHQIEPDTVVITIDGDDHLKHKRVFQKIASLYASNKNIWMTHGSYDTNPPGYIIRSAPIPSFVPTDL
jgi:cellulose synthase/poly-beta-1,6-N-acetylglucosamine synthase-like glycosyltransferase